MEKSEAKKLNLAGGVGLKAHMGAQAAAVYTMHALHGAHAVGWCAGLDGQGPQCSCALQRRLGMCDSLPHRTGRQDDKISNSNITSDLEAQTLVWSLLLPWPFPHMRTDQHSLKIKIPQQQTLEEQEHNSE